jgi:peptidoglycan hydrolase-like amidase
MKKIVTLICILGISLTVNLNMVQAKQLKQAKKVEATTQKKLLSQNSVKGVNKKYMEGIEKIFSGVNRYNKDGQEFYSEAQDIRNDFLSEEYKDASDPGFSLFAPYNANNHNRGMSQFGAGYLAGMKSMTYLQILDYYYYGQTVQFDPSYIP